MKKLKEHERIRLQKIGIYEYCKLLGELIMKLEIEMEKDKRHKLSRRIRAAQVVIGEHSYKITVGISV